MGGEHDRSSSDEMNDIYWLRSAQVIIVLRKLMPTNVRIHIIRFIIIIV